MKKEQILELQKFLNRLKITGKNGKALKENGTKSLQTETAIQTLQLILGIHTDGNAGDVTWSLIERIRKDLFEQPMDELPILRANHAGGRLVSYIQYRVGVDVDGIYGANTTNAVKKFQSENKLTDDGIVGSKTWQKLID